MKRRDLLKTGLIAALGVPFATPNIASSLSKSSKKTRKVKNIIFMVSDGMSSGTLTLGNLLSQRKRGKNSNWIQLYVDNKAKRALMDTSSANSLVTDSAAGSSSWGGGMKVNNGALNVGPKGELPVPILQKFKKAGKAVACVTTVPITHATPAGFCINNKSRRNQPEIAKQYIPLKFDVMMGGGLEFFLAKARSDGEDVFAQYEKNGWQIVKTRDEMFKVAPGKPTLGVFNESALPYTVDQNSDESLQKRVPTLAEMLSKSISLMESNENGFVIQVEGGKVDWAAHSNDAPALIYDQLAFDDAVGVAIKFAEKRDDTLVILTTDHGNGNPGLFYGEKADSNFDKMIDIKHSNEWVFQQIADNASADDINNLFKEHQGVELTKEQSNFIAERFKVIPNSDKSNARMLPHKELAEFQRAHFSIHFGDLNHSADHVELAMFGAGSEALQPFTINTDLHNFMLEVCGLNEYKS